MEEELEPPECPICLQPYDAVSSVPRVLSCGHTTCEPCLNHLPNPFPNTIRCSICTLLVKFPNRPSSLPKNLDLLHFSAALQRRQSTEEKQVISQPSENRRDESGVSALTTTLLKSWWSYEFYCEWRKWVLPKDCVLIGEVGLESDGGGVVCGRVLECFESGYVVGCVLREGEDVGLVKVGILREREEGSNKFFKSSYESRVMTVLSGMKEEERDKLGIFVRATHKVCNVGKAYGFWYNEDDNCVYVVCENFKWPSLMECAINKKCDGGEMLSIKEISGLGMIGMEACEILSRLHLEGIVIGFLSESCFHFNDFGRVCVDLSKVLNMGRRVNMALQRARKDLEVNILLDENFVFISPEMLLRFLVKKGFELDCGKTRHEVDCASDVWSLSCLLAWLILGSPFVKEMESFLNAVFNAIKDGKSCDYSGLYTSWMEKVEMLLKGRLGSGCASLQEILCSCLKFDPGNRPLITELWKCLRELVVKPQFDVGFSLKGEAKKENSGNCVVLVELCCIVEETEKELINGFQGKEKKDVEIRADKDVVEGISTGHVKCIEMKGHVDYITALAIGGGYLFGSSYDKMVHVWSLQDFTHVHSFKSHEHRVMAVVFVDGEQPLCISGDNEGVICIWKATFPFSEVPINKLFEEKDWRYSGIHAMAISGTDFLYTGSGDRLVKAWSLQDYTLSCAMSGHKSVVSSLKVCDGVLCSGSWDGTVRLWSLSDHSPLAVLGEDKLGNFASVLSLAVDRHLLFVGHENGTIKIWHNDVLVKSTQAHKGAVFSVSKNGKWLFSGSWDKTVNMQEISEDVDGVEVTPVGSISCDSTITALIYWQGKLFVGQADRIVKVYHGM